MTYAPYQRPKSNRRRIITLAVVVVVVTILAAVGIFWSMSGNQATINTPPAKKAATPVTDQLYNGKYVEFSYKGVYHVSKPKNIGDDLEVATFTADTDYDKSLAVEVSPLPDSKLENNSGYNYRKNTPNTYTSRTLAVDGGTAVVYTKGQSEQTAFIQYGNKIVVLSFTTTPGNFDNLQPEVDALLQTFHWKGV